MENLRFSRLQMSKLAVAQGVGLGVLLTLVGIQMSADVARLSAEIASGVRFLVTAMTLIMVVRRHPRARAAVEATGWVIIGSIGFDYALHHPIPQVEFAQCLFGTLLLLSSFVRRPVRRARCDVGQKPTMSGGA